MQIVNDAYVEKIKQITKNLGGRKRLTDIYYLDNS